MKRRAHQFLKGTCAYLSGPMDFVANRKTEKRFGWRVRMKQFLHSLEVRVFDPWDKPRVRGFLECDYGVEDVKTIKQRDKWTFKPSSAGAIQRAQLSQYFWQTMHIDLRMVDLSDFVVAYCPTNIYSVGTVHEIVVARQQNKPVLMVSPSIDFPTLEAVEDMAHDDKRWKALIAKLTREVPIKENLKAIPSLWYISLVGSESFFDGFGFYRPEYQTKFPEWKTLSSLDKHETRHRPRRPLLPFLSSLAKGNRVPKTWDHASQQFVDDDDWLLMERIRE